MHIIRLGTPCYILHRQVKCRFCLLKWKIVLLYL
nr:MAG TPA: Protein of unknown function (DUF1244) [Caudoviricetes sp.]